MISVFCVLSAFMWTKAQRIVPVSGEDTYYAPSNMTLEQAKFEALVQARKKVLEARFGTNINSTTSLLIDNRDSTQSKSRTEVQTISVHEVKGEWIEDTREPEQEVLYDNSMPNTTIIRTRVSGRAREITAPKADIEVHILKDTIAGTDADAFKDGQSFYLSFQTPVPGYVAVYLLDFDEESAYCLLPAPSDYRGIVPVESNRRYVFFSDRYAASNYSKTDQSLGTEYFFTTSRSVSSNLIYVIFSPSEFFKANDRQERNKSYVLPRETTIPLFNKWLVNCKVHDTQMVEKIISVRILK